MNLPAPRLRQSSPNVIPRWNYAPIYELNGKVVAIAGDVDPEASALGFLEVLWRHRHIWFMPLACECVLFLVAFQMSLVLAKVMSGGVGLSDWLAVAVAGGMYAVGRLLSEANELFMPRFVLLAGVGVLIMATVTVIGFLLTCSPGDGFIGLLGLKMRLLLVTPLVFFLILQFFLIQGAQYAPEISSLELRRANNFNLIGAVRRQFRYWTR
ncbi:MAG: hypothetical protein WC661_21275 [Opitutaceae bacterium]|jgi:hypothetical protein